MKLFGFTNRKLLIRYKTVVTRRQLVVSLLEGCGTVTVSASTPVLNLTPTASESGNGGRARKQGQQGGLFVCTTLHLQLYAIIYLLMT